METPHDAILLYNSKDEERARDLFVYLSKECGLRIWFAPESLPLGDLILQIFREMTRSRVVLACIGKHSVGRYEEWEIGTALDEAIRKKLRLIPIYLRGSISPEEVDLPILRSVNYVDLRLNGRDPLALGKLVSQLRESQPRTPVEEGGPVVQVNAPSDGSAGSEAILKRLAHDMVATQGVTIFVGSTFPERHRGVVPNPYGIAVELLGEMGLLGTALVSHPLMPASQAAFVYSLKKGKKAVEADMAKRVGMRSVGEPEAYTELVSFLRKVAPKDRSGSLQEKLESGLRYLIVTTNADLGLERAFLKGGLPFSRLVVSWDSHDIRWIDVGSVEERDGGYDFGSNESRTRSRSREEIPQNDLKERTKKRDAMAGAKPDLELFLDTAELNHAIRQHVSKAEKAIRSDRLATPDLLKLTQPLILKIYGSCENTYAFTTDHYCALGRRSDVLPTAIATAIRMSPSLFLGWHLSEPHFVHLYSTFLSELFKHDANATRVALVESTPSPPQDGQDVIDAALAVERYQFGMNRFRVEPLEGMTPTEAFARLATSMESFGTEWGEGI